MAVFAASFTASQSINGATLIFTDTSNYGVDSTHNKTNFIARALLVVRGDNTGLTTTYNFPFTGTPNSTQDTFALTVTADYSYSVTLQLTYSDSSLFTANNPVVTEQFIILNKLTMLNMVQPCDCNDYSLLDAIDKINIALQSAVQRSSVGDTAGSYQLLSYAFETTQLYVS